MYYEPSTSTSSPAWALCPNSQVPVLRRTTMGGSAPATPTGQSRNTESKLSTKRERTTPRSVAPPKVVRSATSKSVFARRKPEEGFITLEGITPFSSLFYSPTRATFFEQVFRFEELLGKGSFGEVNAARCYEDRQLYAIKIAPVRHQNSVLRHSEVLSHLRIPAHPNLVKFIRAWEEADRIYIQLEYCPQTLLKWVTESGGLEEKDVWNVSVDLMLAVNHLHKIDMIHNDIKPENVLVTKEGVCKLCDLGTVIDLKTGFNSKEDGDSRYMAQEVLDGQASKASDIFSLGLTILETATDLDVPSNGEEWHELRRNIIPDRLLAGVSMDLRGLIEAMMKREPEERPTTEELLDHPRIKELSGGRCQYVESRKESPVQPASLLPLPMEVLETRLSLMETPSYKKMKVPRILNFDDSEGEEDQKMENIPTTSTQMEEQENAPSMKRRAEEPLQLTPTVRRNGMSLRQGMALAPRAPTGIRFNLDEDVQPTPSIQRRVRVSPLNFD